MGRREYSRPVVVQGDRVTSLERIPFPETPRNEKWLQELLFAHRELIPFEELDPLFRDSVPVAMEVESGVGPIDILYVNSDGLLTIVETKLWRNPEARRTAVAQIINYAARLSLTTFEDLTAAVEAAPEGGIGALVAAARKSRPDFDEIRFHDGLIQNLRHGRFLLLIIGDGIREDVDEMTEFLNRRPDLGFTLRLVEMAIYSLGTGESEMIFVQPHILARSREIVRAVVTTIGNNVRVEVPAGPTATGGPVRYKIGEDQFFAELTAEGSPKAVEFVRWMIDHAAEHQLSIQWMQAGPVFKHFLDDGTFFTLFQFSKGAWLEELSRFARRCVELGLDDNVWSDYFDAIAKIVPLAKLQHFKSKAGNEWDNVVFDDHYPPLDALADNKSAWLSAVDNAIERIRAAMR